mmetsp:Transcript_15315/g.14892  ORF Transcript_15315/g.14892 Transcript_15315/m.14892 type:complete len:118 (+) Transcript_15315:677-1030(+)
MILFEVQNRLIKNKRMLFGILMHHYIFHEERVLLRNMNRIRELCSKLIKERKAVLKADPEFSKNHHDFLTIMLQDELFANNDEEMIDECATFFFASTQTSYTVVATALFYYVMKGDK